MLTSFGKVIYELQLLLVEAIDTNLGTVDSLITVPFGTEQNINQLSYSKILVAESN